MIDQGLSGQHFRQLNERVYLVPKMLYVFKPITTYTLNGVGSCYVTFVPDDQHLTVLRTIYGDS